MQRTAGGIQAKHVIRAGAPHFATGHLDESVMAAATAIPHETNPEAACHGMRRQSSQFTSTEFIEVLAGRQIKISVDGKGAWRDNVFVERLWRTIKYEEVYLRTYASVSEARAGIGRYLTFYNGRRPHSSLDGKTPDQAYFSQPMPEAVAT